MPSSTGICLGCADVKALLLDSKSGAYLCEACHPFFSSKKPAGSLAASAGE